MKVILSRKGFDSENGKLPSVVMPDGAVVSFPIPAHGESVWYSDLQYKGLRYNDLLSDLHDGWANGTCHFDPDLDVARQVKRPKKWVPGFGQCSTSLSYLLDTVGVKPGDLFLFFGWFHFVEKVDGKFRYVRKDVDYFHCHDMHLLWGYLQVGEILCDHQEKAKRLPWHPHAADYRASDPHDYIFVARKSLSFAPSLPGAGLLPYSPRRVLTLEGMSKACWKYNKVYDPEHIIGSRKNSARGEGIYYSGIWQELGLQESKSTEAWAKRMILA